MPDGRLLAIAELFSTTRVVAPKLDSCAGDEVLT
jgi:hypothetical protein